MATGFRNPLSKSLASMIMPGDQPEYGMPPMPAPTGTPQEPPGGLFNPGSKGQIIAGIIGDALASLTGGAPVFTQNMMAERQRKQEMEASEAQWSRRRQAGREDKQWEWANKPEEVPSIIRNAEAWGRMTPEQRTNYQAMQEAQAGNVTTTLPNGQLYIGPKSGLAAALGGGSAPAKPVGKLTPIAGGPTPPASGTFRP